MVGILLLFAVLFAFGMFMVCCDIFGVPSLQTSKITLKTINLVNKSEKTMDLMQLRAAGILARRIKISGYKKRRLLAGLRSAGIPLSPEAYIAMAWVKTGTVLLLMIPCLIIFPFLAPIFLMLTITVYFKERGSAEKQLRKQKEEIESEMPRFASTLTQELKASRDVLSMLETYKKNADKSLKRELEITIADMKSGNYEGALTRFEMRVGSGMLSDIVRGLIGVIRGDDGVAYFRMLSHDLKQIELQRLKSYAVRQPAKIKKYSFFMLVCFMGMYIVVLGLQIAETAMSMKY